LDDEEKDIHGCIPSNALALCVYWCACVYIDASDSWGICGWVSVGYSYLPTLGILRLRL